MPFTEFENALHSRTLQRFVDARRPALAIRSQVDLAFRIEDQSATIFETRPGRRQPAEKIESGIAKATYVKSRGAWKVYWRRQDLRWHPYEPMREVVSLDAFLGLVAGDAHAAFWG
jgi:hypothetical protein